MANYIVILSSLLGLLKSSVHGSCDTDIEPCYLFNSIDLPYLSTRHPSTSFTEELSDEKYCDLFALNPDIWYRSTYSMTSHPVDHQACGTNQPIWLNGTIPAPTDDIVSRVACVKSFSDDCVTTYTVNVRSCLYYTVYCFPDVPSSCHQRYCFDVNSTEAATTTTATNQATTVVNNGQVSTEEQRIHDLRVIYSIITAVTCFLAIVFPLAGWIWCCMSIKTHPEEKYQEDIGSTTSRRQTDVTTSF